MQLSLFIICCNGLSYFHHNFVFVDVMTRAKFYINQAHNQRGSSGLDGPPSGQSFLLKIFFRQADDI